jgi:hypothetical protein
MKRHTRLFYLCILFISIGIPQANSQIFKKVRAEGGDVQNKYVKCIEIFDNIFTVAINVDISEFSSQVGDLYDNPPCDMYIGFSIDGIAETFYEPIGNISYDNDASIFEGSEIGLISTTFDGTPYGINCESDDLNFSVNLYCKVGQEFYQYSICPQTSVTFPAPRSIHCDFGQNFDFSFCCPGDDGEPIEIIGQRSSDKLKNQLSIVSSNKSSFILKGYDGILENIQISIYSINGQKIGTKSLEKIDNDSILIEGNNLNTGLYFLQVIINGRMQQTQRIILGN